MYKPKGEGGGEGTPLSSSWCTSRSLRTTMILVLVLLQFASYPRKF